MWLHVIKRLKYVSIIPIHFNLNVWCWTKRCCTPWMHWRSLWIKSSAKFINVYLFRLIWCMILASRSSAIANAMPDFHSSMKERLRTPEQGADTVVWLAVSEAAVKNPSGHFFQGEQTHTHTSTHTGCLSKRCDCEPPCGLHATNCTLNQKLTPCATHTALLTWNTWEIRLIAVVWH